MDTIVIPIDIARKAFDIAVGSMDFGSGFLDNDEVDALRAFAVSLGVNPMEATPHGFRAQYPHLYEPVTRPATATPYWDERIAGNCRWCGRKQHPERKEV